MARKRLTPHSATPNNPGKSNLSHQPQRNGGRNAKRGRSSSMSRPPGHSSESSSTIRNVLDFLSPWKISLVTWSLRCLHVWNRDNWWMVHPDEVFQSVEIGHIEVYGYGFRSYEYSPPDASANDTRYHRLLMEAGLGAMRSPIFPYFYTLVHFLAFHVGIKCNPFLISRLAHVCMTSLLPTIAYHVTRRLFRSRDTALLAAILTASSAHLNVYGTRCLVQSFLSPVTFFAFFLILSITDAPKHTVTGYNAEKKPSNGWDKINNNNNNNINDSNNRDDYNQQEVTLGSSASSHGHRNGVNLDHQTISHSETAQNNKDIDLHVNNVIVNNQNGYVSTQSEPSLRKECLTLGFLVGSTCYIRPDEILIHAVNFFVILSWRRKKRLSSFVFITFLGIILSLLTGAICDRLFYKEWVISPYNWVKANLVSDFSTGIFGKMSFEFYVKNILYQDSIIFILCQICALVIIGVYLARWTGVVKWDPQTDNEVGEDGCGLRQCVSLLFGWILSLLAFSLHGHKEVRFIHDTIVLMLIFVSGVTSLAIGHISTRLCMKTERLKLAFVVLLLLLQSRQQPGPQDSNAWAYQSKESSHSINTCLEFVSLQKDARGVFLDSSFFMTGGMSVLHHDIPILSLLVDGFYEFGFDSRLNFTSNNAIFPLNRKHSNSHNLVEDTPRVITHYSINTFTRASNYVSQANAKAVVRLIIKNTDYNYLILRKNRRFMDKGFEEVFQTGNQKVLKRTYDAASEIQLRNLLERVPLGTNATVLLHEGDVLSYMGRYREAVERFQASLAIQPGLVEAYFPLHTALMKLGHKQEASKVLASCYKIGSKGKCTAVRPLTSVN